MFFSKRKEENHTLCVLDIGSGSVAGAFAKFEKGKKPEIDFTYRSHIKEAVPGVPYERYYLSMISSLEEVTKKLAHNTKVLPTEIIIYLRSPWIASTSRTIKKKSLKNFTFDKNFLAKAIASDNQDFIKTLLDGSGEHGAYRIIDQRLEGVKIKGYDVRELPKKIDVDDVTIRTFITVAPEEIITDIENVATLEFGTHVDFKSFSRSICNLSKQFIPDVENYILFDVGSLVTEISIIKNCQMVETMTLPQGYAHINKEILKSPNLDKGLVDAVAHGHAEEKIKTQVDSVTSKAREKWIGLVSETLDKFSTQLALPSTLVLMTEDTNPLFFANILKGESFAQFLITDKKFNVIIMNANTFENVCAIEGCKPDALLMAEAVDMKNKYYA